MKLNRIEVSKMVYYYYNDDDINKLVNVLGEPDSIIFDKDDIIKLTLSSKDNDSIFEMLRKILHNSSKITLGNNFAYAYEMDLYPEENDICFNIATDYGIYKSILTNVYYNSNNNLEIVFKKK